MKILLVEDDTLFSSDMANHLSNSQGHDVVQCVDGHRAFELFQQTPFSLVITDIQIPGYDGIELLKKIKKTPYSGDTDVVMITGYANTDTAIESLRAGAYDYLCKPFQSAELAAVVSRVVEHRALITENRLLTHHYAEEVDRATRETRNELKRLRSAYAEIVGLGTVGLFSDSMKAVFDMACRFHRDRSIPVLIEGETGTGKEILARVVHYGEGDETAPFVSINCSAISPNLFESELFGYEPGAFTGAKKEGSKGKFEMAQSGTLFLDEIGDFPLELQPKLLRAIQEKEIYRIGGLRKIGLDIRIICATNRDIESLVKKNAFRKDLYYRLNKGRIHIPPLRERREAIGPLAQLFLDKYVYQKKLRFKSITKEALTKLNEYDWPGNVRELQNVIERVLLLFDDTEIRPEYLSILSSDGKDTSLAGSCLLRPGLISLPDKGIDLREIEAEIVRKSLVKFKGNKTHAAEFLGMSRGAFINRLKRSI